MARKTIEKLAKQIADLERRIKVLESRGTTAQIGFQTSDPSWPVGSVHSREPESDRERYPGSWVGDRGE